MSSSIQGLHHVTAICGAPQQNLDFYTGPLGQRLVKRTVNFDDPGTYHLYYGDRQGAPGTILTFFPFVDAGPGRAGPGMASAVAYGAAPAAFDALMDRWAAAAVDFAGPEPRFGARVLALADPDGLPVEIVESEAGDGGFHSVTLWLRDPLPTARLMSDVMGYELIDSESLKGGERIRLQAPGGATGNVVDLLRTDRAPVGRQGAGTIHHVAFRARDDADQLEWRERLAAAGMQVTPVIDRQYFNAIYFREPGGVLFEIATDPPGFAVDEPIETLGEALKLPSQYESRRAAIERRLPPLRLPKGQGA